MPELALGLAGFGRSDLGRLEPAARGDLVWLSDDLDVRATRIDGRLAHGPAWLAHAAVGARA